MTRVVLLICLAASDLIAQNGSLSGLVRDPAAAAISGAAFELKNTETGAPLATDSSDSGLYSFPSVTPARTISQSTNLASPPPRSTT